MCTILATNTPIVAATFVINIEIPTVRRQSPETYFEIIKEPQFLQPDTPGQIAYRVSAQVESVRLLKALFLDYVEEVATTAQVAA